MELEKLCLPAVNRSQKDSNKDSDKDKDKDKYCTWWNWKSFVFQLLAIDDNCQVVEGGVDCHAAVDPCHLLDRS